MNNQNNQNNQNNFNDRNEDSKRISLPEIMDRERDGKDGEGKGRGNGNGKKPSPKVNRALYVTAVVLLLAVAIIAVATSASNRSKKQPLETPVQTDSIQTPSQTPPQSPEPESSKPAESEKPEETKGNSEDVSGKLPVFSLPVSGALGVKHDPELQVFSPTMKEYRVHLGIDINTTDGAPVYAAAKGSVSRIWNDPMMGWCVELKHDGQAFTYYKNLGETLATGISEGASVKAGQLLGAVGESAILEVAQEPHLHFEMKVGGASVDPLDYFSADELKELGVDEGYEG